MDSQQNQWQESDALIATSWARIFDREAEWAVDAATRDAALARAAEARAQAAQLRQAQDREPGAARVSLTDAERAAARQIARGTGQPVHVMDVQAQPDRPADGRVTAAETREQAARADDERARQRQAERAQRDRAAAAERSGREASR